MPVSSPLMFRTLPSGPAPLPPASFPARLPSVRPTSSPGVL
jgi:hypothetical protein